jgi:hypothetical protein
MAATSLAHGPKALEPKLTRKPGQRGDLRTHVKYSRLRPSGGQKPGGKNRSLDAGNRRGPKHRPALPWRRAGKTSRHGDLRQDSLAKPKKKSWARRPRLEWDPVRENESLGSKHDGRTIDRRRPRSGRQAQERKILHAD